MTSTDAGGLSVAKRQLLQRRLKGRAGAATGPAPVSRRLESHSAPLSVTQEQLWYFSQLTPDNPVYNEAVTIRKDGSFDPDVFRLAFHELLCRHEIWRTTFALSNGDPVQVVGPPPGFPMPLLDLSGLSYAAAQSRAAQLAAADFRRPYDLARGPLVRPRLVRLSADHHRLYLGLHHIIFDGVTLYRVILPELITLYDDIAAGRALSLAHPTIQYSDYAVWERQWIASPVVAARMGWWARHLADAPPLELPLDRPRPARQRFRGGMEPFTLDRELVDGLRELGQRRGATLFQTLAAGFAALLHRYSHQDDVIFGTVGDLRQRPELQSLVGYSLTPLVVRADLRNDPTFEDLLDRVGAEIIEGLDHLVPFERLIRELRPTRDDRANPIFQVTLVLEPKVAAADSEWSLHQMEVEIGNALGTAKFDLSLECDERPEGHISGRLNYDAELLLPETARRLGRHWDRLLREILANPTVPVSRLTILDDEERRQQLQEWNRTDREWDKSATVNELIEAQAQRTPDAVALVHGQKQLTYRQLEQRSDAVARRLRVAGAGQGIIVAICVERSLDMVVGLLGILKSGAAYLPLDPRLPPDRLKFMVQDAGAVVLLTQRHLAPSLPMLTPVVLLIDRCSADTDDPVGVETPGVSASPRSGAYVLYTSGSTGLPKGVLVRHVNVVNYIRSVVEEPGFSHDDVVLAVNTYSFDVSVGDIFPPLTTGARIVIASSADAMDMRRLSRLIHASGATYMHVTPVTWQALIDSGWTGSPKLVGVSGGEPLTEMLARALLPRVAELWNSYGPTETTVTATCIRVRADESITLGRPIANTRVYLLDEHRSLVPVGVTGEIYIAGAGVAAGYVNRSEETTKRFQPDPFRPDDNMYRSGDLGRYLPDGRIQYLGRADTQLKIRGFRIEPGEIEYALLACEGVASAVVVAAREDSSSGDRRLVAYLVPQGQVAPKATVLRAKLRRTLPNYMVPSAFVSLPAMPTTTSGKIDRLALPDPVWDAAEETVAAAPTSPLERDLARIWARMLHLDGVGPDANFFDLGGHSLLAVRTLLEVERELGFEVPLATFFDGGGSVRGMAAAIQRGSDDKHADREVRQPLFFVHPQPATVPSMRHFTGALGPGQRIEVLLPERVGGRFDTSRSMAEMTLPLLQSVRASQPSGPYLIAGYSLGGLLAYELATQLIAMGESVAWLGLLDTPSPSFSGQHPSQRQLFGLYASRGWPVLVRQCRSALRRELRTLRVRLHPDPQLFDYRGATILGASYSPEGIDAPLAVFATDAMVTDHCFGPSLGWEGVHKGLVEIHHIPGNHESLLLQPNVDVVANLFSRSLLRKVAHPNWAAPPRPADLDHRPAPFDVVD